MSSRRGHAAKNKFWFSPSCAGGRTTRIPRVAAAQAGLGVEKTRQKVLEHPLAPKKNSGGRRVEVEKGWVGERRILNYKAFLFIRLLAKNHTRILS